MNRTKQDLEGFPVKYLRGLAKEQGLKGYSKMTKQELIGILVPTEVAEVTQETSENNDGETIQKTHRVVSESSGKPSEKTKNYIKNLEAGKSIVAFRCVSAAGKDYAISGMYLNKYDDGTYKIQTKSGDVYAVVEKDILWVKTGNRWPSWVFGLFSSKNEKGTVQKEG